MSIADDESQQRRRASDAEVAQDLRLINMFREELTNTRHDLRNEFTVIANDLRLDFAATTKLVQAGNLAQVTETARMQAKLEEIASDQADMRREVRSQREDFEPRLRQLEANDLAADKVSGLIRWTVGAALTVCGVVIGAAAFLAQHIS